MTRLAYLVTDPLTADSFLRGQLTDLSHIGYDVHLISAPGPRLDDVGRATGATVHAVPFQREIAPLSDAKALLTVTALLRRLAPDLVNASTPKAGLLGLLAARRAGVRHRIYLVRGLRLETSRGLKRLLLTSAERRAAKAATRIYSVSSSLRRRYAALGLAPIERIRMLGSGSSNGVDAERFAEARSASARREVRSRLDLPAEAPVIGFVGRLTRDKGIADLVSAFLDTVRTARPDARLVLFGDFEEGDRVGEATRKRITAEASILVQPFVPRLAAEYSVFDVLAFPSYREGFPNVPLEAAASGLPVVGYSATGTIDAVVDGATGTLVEVGDRRALGEALLAYLDDGNLRNTHGTAALKRVLANFRSETVRQAWADEYERILAAEAA